jgi:hypothetical protein
VSPQNVGIGLAFVGAKLKTGFIGAYISFEPFAVDTCISWDAEVSVWNPTLYDTLLAILANGIAAAVHPAIRISELLGF